ncbi:MAG: cytidylate kinase-like family protein [Lachnospiraceae bacterium]|nr:cytidylate kinase-like family protein [Lachnospiraceae bacterium]
MQEQVIISIGREFGSGGHEVAELIAEKLEIYLLDDKLLYNLSAEKKIPYEEVKKYDEKPKMPFLSRTVAGYTNAMEEHLAKMQFKYLKQMAEKGESFVIVGRCAEFVLKDYDCMTSAFIRGDMDSKVARVMKKYELSAEEAKKLMKKKDATRKAYHNYYCEGKWGDSRNYDLCINSSKLGIEGTVDVILSYVEKKAKS